MFKRDERAERARRAAARQAPRKAEPRVEKSDLFSVIISAHRPRYRARAERATSAVEGWEVKSLLNREDPIGLMNRKAPDIFIVSIDKEKKAGVGYLRAAQRFRTDGTKIIILCETAEDAATAGEQGDVLFVPPWKASQLRKAVLAIYWEKRGEQAVAENATAIDEE